MHHTVRGVYLQAFLVPSAQPCLPQNELLMTPCAFIFQTVLSGCNWPFQTFDSFYTGKQSPSLRRGPLHRFQHQSRHRITFQMSDSLSSFYSPSRKELFPVSVFAPACITLRKSRFHMHRQRKRMWEADHPPILPPLPPPSPNIYIFLYIYLMGGGAYNLSKCARILVDSSLSLITRRAVSRCSVDVVCTVCTAPPPDFFSVASLGFTCRNEPHSLQAAVILTIIFFLHSSKYDKSRPAYYLCQLTLSGF